MTALIGCEESQEICKALRAKGVEAYSCDLKKCSGGRPEWHFKMDVFKDRLSFEKLSVERSKKTTGVRFKMTVSTFLKEFPQHLKKSKV